MDIPPSAPEARGKKKSAGGGAEKIRGVEAALRVLEQSAVLTPLFEQKNAPLAPFISESLRNLHERIVPSERSLAATLAYSVARRRGLWFYLMQKVCKRPVHELDPHLLSVLYVGIAGVLELRHFKRGVLINALLERLKKAGAPAKDVGLANAVLRRTVEMGPLYIDELRASGQLRDFALAQGVPGWVASKWSDEYGVAGAKALLKLATMRTYLSLRVSPGASREECVERLCSDSGVRAWSSPMLESSIRLAQNAYPAALAGYAEGLITPQTESSQLMAEFLNPYWNGGYLLDLCSGRGIKCGQLALMRRDAQIGAFEIDPGKRGAWQKEMRRLGVSDRVSLATGDALMLPAERPVEAVFLDAPCSGSGTWGRHPETKWRCGNESVLQGAQTQLRLLVRALDVVQPGGVVMYCTCSLFREENEKVVAAAISGRGDVVELPIRLKNPLIRKGRPYGMTVWPGLPWVDGFYAAILMKRKLGGIK